MTVYQTLIAEFIAKFPQYAGVDPRHVEAYMRMEYRTLAGLTPAKFNKAAREAIEDVLLTDSDANEALAQSYGL